MGQGMAGVWLRADTIRRSTNTPKMPVLDIAINVEARRGEARRGDLLPATCYLPLTTSRYLAGCKHACSTSALQGQGRKVLEGRKGGEEEREGEAKNPLPSILYSLPRQPAHAAPIDA
jgi:hypothetical protein